MLVLQRLCESTSVDDFLVELRMLIQRLECGSQLDGAAGTGGVLPCSCYAKLMADLDELGWPRCDPSPPFDLVKIFVVFFPHVEYSM